MRLLPFAASHPHANMGLDEALLRCAQEPTLRFYSWAPTGLSLGYFQAWTDFCDLPGDHVPVRRLTGGGAIYHQHELTFSLTGPAAEFPDHEDVEALYGRIHSAIAETLQAGGHQAHPAGGGRSSPRPRDRWCFDHPTSFDLLGAGGGKLLGSAQRRMTVDGTARLLHHGSLVLCPPDYPRPPIQQPGQHPGCAGLYSNPASAAAHLPTLADLLAHSICGALGQRLAPGHLSSKETTLAADLTARRYADPSFLTRR